MVAARGLGDSKHPVLARAPGKASGLWLYRHLPGFAWLSETVYTLVAHHREAAYRWSRLLWGPERYPPTYRLVSWLFLRLLGLTFLVAFVSIGNQIIGLVGADGILGHVLGGNAITVEYLVLLGCLFYGVFVVVYAPIVLVPAWAVPPADTPCTEPRWKRLLGALLPLLPLLSLLSLLPLLSLLSLLSFSSSLYFLVPLSTTTMPTPEPVLPAAQTAAALTPPYLELASSVVSPVSSARRSPTQSTSAFLSVPLAALKRTRTSARSSAVASTSVRSKVTSMN